MSRKLKMFVRYDGDGQIVSGSNISAMRKPKTGKWMEINSSLCCISTTTTSLPYNCESVLTVGESQNGYGYAYGEGGYGSLVPNCEDILILMWATNGEFQLYTQVCYDSLTVYINEQEFVMSLQEFFAGMYLWHIVSMPNPFPNTGETCIIKLLGVNCTTTTTTTNL